jgi:hypothetical protein
MSKIRYNIIMGALLLALTLSALNVAPAFADENIPPVEPTLTEVVTEGTETASPIVEEAPPPPSVEDVSEPETQSTTVAEVIDLLPENTGVIVLDEEGEVLPLATVDAQEAAVLGDPRWCPAGAVPPSGCSPSFAKFVGVGGLIEWLNNPLNAAIVSKAGTIWVEAAYDSSTNEDITTTSIVLDGSSLTNMSNYALTINGGWLPNVSMGGSALSTTDLSEFNVPLSIINWHAPVTVKNVSVNNVTSGTYALEVGTTIGLITVTNVDVVNNTVTQAGANLSNDLAITPAGITVNDSNFNSNTATGLEILTKGAVNIKNVTSNDNGEYGIVIDNTPALTAQAVNLTGTNQLNSNGLDGLVIFSKGAITLNYIMANYNDGTGVYLDNCAINYGTGLCTNLFSSTVIIKGVNDFSNNGWDGLRVFSGGVISVSNIIANNNGTDPLRDGDMNTDYDTYGKGVYLDNSGALIAKRTVNVTGVNTFNGNKSNGLFVISDGLISLSNITANQNSCDIPKEGNFLYCAGVYLYSFGGVTQTGYANFVNNDQDGLRITTFNTSVILTTVYATDNGKDGIHIDGGISSLPANITINGSNFANHNGQFGFWTLTNGAITLNNITANYNGDAGLYADNTVALSAKNVTLKGVNTFQGNSATGLTVFSRGAIVTYSINAIENVGQAAIFDNCDDDGLGNCQAYTVTIKGIPNYQAVTMFATNFLNNNGNGLAINSRGAITIYNLTSIYNNNTGALLKNDYINGGGNVTLAGTNNLSYNGTDGIEISSLGSVSLTNISANYNGGSGAEIVNNFNPSKPGNVSLLGINRISNNEETGLYIESNGTVTLYSITANDNGVPDFANGVEIDNETGTLTAKPVILYGYNYFNDNSGSGLVIDTLGAITVYRVTANNNTENGARLDNEIPSGTQPITIIGYGTFLNNGTNGLQISSNGSVTAASLSANLNGSQGVLIDTQYNAISTSAVNVTITGYNNFNSNGIDGLQVIADGAITLTNIFANGNDNNGVTLDNSSYANGSINKTIILNGVNNFSNNSNNGLDFSANGAVTVNRLVTFGNTDLGGLLTGSGIVGSFGGGTSLKTFTFNCGSVTGNELSGINLTGATTITLKGLYLGQSNVFGVTPVITRACPLP